MSTCEGTSDPFADDMKSWAGEESDDVRTDRIRDV